MTSSTVGRPRTRLSSLRDVIYDWWVAAVGIALIFGSDYKMRIRAVDASIDGGVDKEILLEIGLYALVAAFVLYSFPILPKSRRVPAHVYLAGCFVVLVVVSASYSPYMVYSAVRGAQLCILMTFVLAASQYATRAHFHRFAHAYLLLICGSVFYGLVKTSPPVNPRQVGRFTWLAIHPTVSGLLSGLAVVVVVSYLWRASSDRPGPMWSRATYSAILVVVGAALLMTQTRGAIGAALVGLLMLCTMRLGARRLIEFVLGLIVVAATIALAAGQIITTYFERGETTENLTTLNDRTELWSVAWQATLKNPVFGYGIGAARGIFYTATGLGGGHNAVVNVLVELGVVGLVTWLLLIVALAVGATRLSRFGPRDAGLDRAMIVAILAYLMFDGIFYEGAGSVANAGSTWLFMICAWLSVAQRSETEYRRRRHSVSTNLASPNDSSAAPRTS